MARLSVEGTLAALQRILDKNEPINPEKIEAHRERKEIAQEYHWELTLLYSSLPEEVIVVNERAFQKVVDDSDFVKVENHKYVRIANAINFPETESKTYVWLTPISKI